MNRAFAMFVKRVNWYAFSRAKMKPGARFGNAWQIFFRFVTRPLNDAVRSAR